MDSARQATIRFVLRHVVRSPDQLLLPLRKTKDSTFRLFLLNTPLGFTVGRQRCHGVSLTAVPQGRRLFERASFNTSVGNQLLTFPWLMASLLQSMQNGEVIQKDPAFSNQWL